MPVAGVLLGEGCVEAVGVAESGDVGGCSAFAEHLDDGVAGDEVDEEKDDGDDDPENREGEEDASERLPELEPLMARRSGELWRSGQDAGALPFRLALLAQSQNDTFLLTSLKLFIGLLPCCWVRWRESAAVRRCLLR